MFHPAGNSDSLTVRAMIDAFASDEQLPGIQTHPLQSPWPASEPATQQARVCALNNPARHCRREKNHRSRTLARWVAGSSPRLSGLISCECHDELIGIVDGWGRSGEKPVDRTFVQEVGAYEPGEGER